MLTAGSSSMYLFASTVLAVFFDLITGETCMKATRSGESDRDLPGLTSWQWVNFECRTGCCGDKGNQRCCPESENVIDSPGMITTIAVAVFMLFISIVIIVVCCMFHRSRQKRSQRMRTRRHTVASMTPSTGSLPPSYEMTVAMSAADSTGGAAFPAEVHSPPSYEEAVAGSPSYSVSDQARPAPTAHVPAHAPEEHAHVRGRDNPAFSLRNETNTTSVSVIS